MMEGFSPSMDSVQEFQKLLRELFQFSASDIRFQYRELTEKEVKDYQVEGGSNTAKQEKINQSIYEEILKRIKNLNLKAQLSKKYGNEKSLLLYQIARFTAKNTKDYFIHKNLKKFLSEGLDYFIKNDMKRMIPPLYITVDERLWSYSTFDQIAYGNFFYPQNVIMESGV